VADQIGVGGDHFGDYMSLEREIHKWKQIAFRRRWGLIYGSQDYDQRI